MNTLQSTQEQIKISVSKELKSLVRSRAQEIGVPVTQYVKHLIINDVKKPTYQVDEETEKRIGQALEDYKEGRYIATKNKKELDDYLDLLNK